MEDSLQFPFPGSSFCICLMAAVGRLVEFGGQFLWGIAKYHLDCRWQSFPESTIFVTLKTIFGVQVTQMQCEIWPDLDAPDDPKFRFSNTNSYHIHMTGDGLNFSDWTKTCPLWPKIFRVLVDMVVKAQELQASHMGPENPILVFEVVSFISFTIFK